MVSERRIAGAGGLLLAPIIVITANLVRPTLSDDAATQVTAFADHRGAMIAGIARSAPRWGAAAIGIGALGTGAGFGTGTKGVVIVAFAILFVGLIEAVRAVVAGPVEQTAAKTPAGSIAAASGQIR